MIARCCSTLTVGFPVIRADGIEIVGCEVGSGLLDSFGFTVSVVFDALRVASVVPLVTLDIGTWSEVERSIVAFVVLLMVLWLLLFVALAVSCFVTRKLSVDLRMRNGIGGAVSLAWNVLSLLLLFRIIERSGLVGWVTEGSFALVGGGATAGGLCFVWKIFDVGIFREFFWKLARRAFRQFWLFAGGEAAVVPLFAVVVALVSGIALSSLIVTRRARIFITEAPGVFNGGRWKRRSRWSEKGDQIYER